MLIAGDSVVVAQSPSMQQQQLESIVAVQPADGTPGSGLIIAVEGNKVRILTAKHVVEGDAPVPDVDPAAQRAQYPCARTPVAVTFKFDLDHPVKSTSADCSDLIDMAVIEVDRPSSWPKSLPRFAEARSSADQENYQVFLAGLAAGVNWASLSGEIISKSDYELLIHTVGVQAGFSGGAVFDRQTGFLGIIVTAGGDRVTAVPLEALKQQLRIWKVSAAYIEGAPVRDNTYFRVPRARDAPAEDARNAVRRYRGAFVGRDAAALRKAYPDIHSRSLSLFGDSNSIELVLRDCDDRDSITTITCEFDLTVNRKTGPIVRARSRDYKPADNDTVACTDAESCEFGRMLFQLSKSDSRDDPFGFQITNVCIEKTTDCPDPSKVTK